MHQYYGDTNGGVSGSPVDRHGHTYFIFNYHQFGFAFELNAFVGKRKLRMIASAGLVANFLADESTTIKLSYDESEEVVYSSQLEEAESFNLSALISLGADYALSQRVSFRAEPSFRYGLEKMCIGTPITAYLWNAGINLGCYFRL